MSGSKYVDIPSVTQVIGCVAKSPKIVQDSGVYFFREEDFTNEIHKIVFGALQRLVEEGSIEVTPIAVEANLKNFPSSYGIYQASNGSKLVKEWKETADVANFDYYYNRMKKMTLLRSYESLGLDLNWLYDPDGFIDNPERHRKQEARFNKMSLSDIANEIDGRIRDVRISYVDNSENEPTMIGDGLAEYLDALQEKPAVGYPMYGRFVNSVYRGARLGKFYLRSASTGTGKSRSMLADACYFSCGQLYDAGSGQWVSTGCPQLPTYFISVELDEQELQTMAVAFLSGVNERKILNQYSYPMTFEEQDRVAKAVEILKTAPLHIAYLPDYSLRDVENLIKRGIYRHNCKMFVLDYIATSMSIIEEVATRSSGMKLREDNVLFLLSSKLKDICSKYNIFILSATQISGEYKTEAIPDQTLLRGSKAIADRIDIGTIMLDCTPSDIEKVMPICAERGLPVPNVKMSVYKNRGGKDARIFLWMVADKGTCRYDTVFATTYSFEWYNLDDLKITIGGEG